MQETLGQVSNTHRKLGVVVHVYNPSILVAKAGGPEVQDLPWLSNDLEAYLSYVKPCLNQSKQRH